MITSPVAEFKSRVEQHFDLAFQAGTLYQLGVYNRRFIAGTSRWSQHAWGNAWDLGSRNKTIGDQVHDFLRTEDRAERLKVGLILWQVPNHYGHLHIEGDPKKTGTPPPKEGQESAVEEFIKAVQDNLNETGFTDYQDKKLVVDGILGARTKSAMLKRDQAAADGGGDGLQRGDRVTLT